MVCVPCAFLRCPIVCLTQPLVNQCKNTSMFIHDRGKRAHETTRPPVRIHSTTTSRQTTSLARLSRRHDSTLSHVAGTSHSASHERTSHAHREYLLPANARRSQDHRCDRRQGVSATGACVQSTTRPPRKNVLLSPCVKHPSPTVQSTLRPPPSTRSSVPNRSPRPAPEQAKTSPKRAHRLRLRSLVCGARSGLRVTECWRAMLISTRTPGT